MVCFDIVVAYPLPQKGSSCRIYERRFEHLRKHCDADFISDTEINGVRYLRVAICDESAVAFLRDVPEPTYCVDITIRHTDVFLYSNFKATNRWVKPPREWILKRVYWTASTLEKWQPTLSIQKKELVDMSDL